MVHSKKTKIGQKWRGFYIPLLLKVNLSTRDSQHRKNTPNYQYIRMLSAFFLVQHFD